MANQLLVNPFPLGVSESQYFQELNGSIQLAGSAVATGEPINWSDLVSGIGYNEINYLGNGVNGNGTALVTALSGDGTTVTATAANNFSANQQVKFKGCTSAMGLLLNGVSVTIVTASSSQFTFLNAANTTGSNEVGIAVVDKSVHPLLVGTAPTKTVAVTGVSASGSIGTATAVNALLPGAQVSFGTFTTGSLGPKLVAAGPMIVLSSTSSAFKFQMPSALTGSTGASTATAINPPQPFSVNFWSALGSGYIYQYSATTGVLFADSGLSGTLTGTLTAPALTMDSYTPAGTNATSTLAIGAGTPANYPVGTGANTGTTTLVATGAVSVTLPAQGFTGTAHTLTGSVAAPVLSGASVIAGPLNPLSAGAYPAAVLADVIKWTAKFPKMAQF